MNYPQQTNIFFHPSLDMAQIEPYKHKYKFYNVLVILLEVPTIQFGITFNKCVEIHLNYRIYKNGSKNFETSTQQYLCSLFYVQKVWSAKDIS